MAEWQKRMMSRARRIAFVGRLGAGKTTAAEMLETMGYKRYSFAAKLKEICIDLFPEKFANGAKPRELLQRVGTDYFRREDPDVWVKYLVRKIQAEDPVLAVVDDCRFPNEAAALKTLGFVIIRLDRTNRDAVGRGTDAEKHPSELEVDHIVPDLVITNDGSIEELKEKLEIATQWTWYLRYGI